MTVRFPADIYEQLRREAFTTKQSMNEIIINAVRRQVGGETGTVYVHVSAPGTVVVTDQADPQEVYRIGPDGETWAPGWRDLGRQTVGDESTHHSPRSVMARAARKIQAIQAEEAGAEARAVRTSSG